MLTAALAALTAAPLLGYLLGVNDPVWRVITMLGDENAYIALTALVYLLWSPELGFRLLLALATSSWINVFAKSFFAVPRPPREHWKVEASGYSFPSGHAQTSATVWAFLSLSLRRWSMWALSAAVVAAVSFSRVYLGVHRVEDVVAGAAFGAAIGGILYSVTQRLKLSGDKGALSLILYGLSVMALYAVYRNIIFFKVGGALLGMAVYPLKVKGVEVREAPLRLKIAVTVGVVGFAYLMSKLAARLSGEIVTAIFHAGVVAVLSLSPLLLRTAKS